MGYLPPETVRQPVLVGPEGEGSPQLSPGIGGGTALQNLTTAAQALLAPSRPPCGL